MLCCDYCYALSTAQLAGMGWWQAGRQLLDMQGAPITALAARRDFCSEPCLRAYYAAAVPTDHPTQRLDSAPTGAAADRARRGGTP